jgi:hypothetical protein
MDTRKLFWPHTFTYGENVLALRQSKALAHVPTNTKRK